MNEREDRFYNKIVNLLLSDTVINKSVYNDDEVYISFPYSHLFGMPGFDYYGGDVIEWGESDSYVIRGQEEEYLMDTYGLNVKECKIVYNRFIREVSNIVKDMFESEED